MLGLREDDLPAQTRWMSMPCWSARHRAVGLGEFAGGVWGIDAAGIYTLYTIYKILYIYILLLLLLSWLLLLWLWLLLLLLLLLLLWLLLLLLLIYIYIYINVYIYIYQANLCTDIPTHQPQGGRGSSLCTSCPLRQRDAALTFYANRKAPTWHEWISGWWFGCHFLDFPRNIGFLSSSQLTNSYFSEGWPNHQPDMNGVNILFIAIQWGKPAFLLLPVISVFFGYVTLVSWWDSAHRQESGHQGETGNWSGT